MCAFGVLWLSCEAPAAPSGGPPGFHTTTREPKRAHLSAPVFKNTTKIQREDPPEREERKKFPAGERKKSAKFWAVQGKGGPAEGGPGERPKNLERTHHTHQQAPPTGTTNRHHQQAPPTGTTNRHHQQAPPTGTTNRHHQQAPPTGTTNRHHQQAPPTGTTNGHHQRAPPTGTTNRHHQQAPPTGTTNRPPKGGASPRVGPPKGGAPKGGGAQNFALFFSLSRHKICSFLPSLGVLSWNFGGVLMRRDAQMCAFGVLWLSCASPRRPGLVGPPGFHTTDNRSVTFRR